MIDEYGNLSSGFIPAVRVKNKQFISMCFVNCVSFVFRVSSFHLRGSERREVKTSTVLIKNKHNKKNDKVEALQFL